MSYRFWNYKISHDINYNLAEEIINNNYTRNGPTTRRGGIKQAKAPLTFLTVAHSTPAKRKRNRRDEKKSRYTDQSH